MDFCRCNALPAHPLVPIKLHHPDPVHPHQMVLATYSIVRATLNSEDVNQECVSRLHLASTLLAFKFWLQVHVRRRSGGGSRRRWRQTACGVRSRYTSYINHLNLGESTSLVILFTLIISIWESPQVSNILLILIISI